MIAQQPLERRQVTGIDGVDGLAERVVKAIDEHADIIAVQKKRPAGL